MVEGPALGQSGSPPLGSTFLLTSQLPMNPFLLALFSSLGLSSTSTGRKQRPQGSVTML